MLRLKTHVLNSRGELSPLIKTALDDCALRGAARHICEYAPRGRCASQRKEQLFIHDNAAAYSWEPLWQTVGWALWQQVDSKSDDYLPLPAHDSNRIVLHKTRYSNDQAMSMAVVERVTMPSGASHCSVAKGAAFWTAHGDRATAPRRAASVSVNPNAWLEDFGLGHRALPTGLCVHTISALW